MIELRELTKRYGDRIAVDDLSFTVSPGRVTGFLGPNGAGKTTTMRMALGLGRPTSGTALVHGRPYAQLREPLRQVGALLEGSAAHGRRRARSHLLWLARSNRIPRTRVREVLGMVGLEDVARKMPQGFSLGMNQRLGIAAALLGDPPLLLLDEPVNGLDPEGILWIRNLMKDLAAEGRTVLVSSHLMSEMALTADHLVVIGKGRLLADTPMNDFIAQHSRSRVRVRTPEPDRMREALTRAGLRVSTGEDGTLEADGTEVSFVGEVASRAGITVHELSRRAASLEEAFMGLTGEYVDHRGTARVPDQAEAAPPGPDRDPADVRTERGDR
ncbi:ATP-binding cassette domain-containing protein [Streptomyces iconiensis]|uniref:ATP-binding cassette domain-containing protein n=1 Tax=Streptomyces iconiensis TaxID=1384038 RepID=A0ABT7A1Q1_9ACTN|nr:ATP-binding cassette domain-containing protein [Streptomyces iconiensis]MDJ1135250.1 ATP-binding cassette domain-containing protein [Streptomyces iconiensis]